MDKKHEDYKRVKWALDLFENESVFDAHDLISGMQSAIQAFLKKQNLKRSLKELKDEVDFLD